MPKPKALRTDKVRQQEGHEARVLQACRYLHKHKKVSMFAAASRFDVSYHTLRRRYKKLNGPHSEGHRKQRGLSKAEEKVFVSWLQFWSAEGVPIGRQGIRLKIEKWKDWRPSLKWVDRFRNRHEEELAFAKSSPLDMKRAHCFNRTAIDRHFSDLLEVLTKHGPFKPENIYNMDEKGTQMGGGRKSSGLKYFYSRQNRSRYKKRSASLELVTIIECVSAAGDSLTPGFIFSGKTKEMEWWDALKDYPFDSIGNTDKGWTDDFQCLQWFKKSFIKAARARAGNDDDPILLIVDGHGSHCVEEMVKLGRANKVFIFRLPPHTTHKTQPLDVGCFGLLGKKWLERCEEVIEETRENITRADFVREYLAVRKKCFTREVILAAWKKTGLYPFNRAVFGDEDFAPSNITSTESYMPDSFPLPDLEDITADDDEDVVDPDSDESVDDSEASHTDDETENEDTCSDEDTVPAESGSSNGTATSTVSVGLEHAPTHLPTSPTSPTSLPATLPAPYPSPLRDSRVRADLSELNRGLPKARLLEVAFEKCQSALEEAAIARKKAEEFATHCHFAHEENKILKRQLNGAKNKKERRVLRTQVAHLTGEEAQAFWEEQARADEARAIEEARKLQAQEDKRIENEQRRANFIQLGSALRFTKPLSQCRRTDLEDIITILGMTIDPKDTVKSLQSRIHAQFTSRPELQVDPRFTGLFPRVAGRRQTAVVPSNDENHSQVASGSSAPPFPSFLADQPLYTMSPLPESRPQTPSLPPQTMPPPPRTTPLSPSNASRIYHHSPHLLSNHYYHPYAQYYHAHSFAQWRASGADN